MAADTPTDTQQTNQTEHAEPVTRDTEQERPSTQETEQPYHPRIDDAKKLADQDETDEDSHDTETGDSSDVDQENGQTPTDELRADDRYRAENSTEMDLSDYPAKTAESAAKPEHDVTKGKPEESRSVERDFLGNTDDETEEPDTSTDGQDRDGGYPNTDGAVASKPPHGADPVSSTERTSVDSAGHAGAENPADSENEQNDEPPTASSDNRPDDLNDGATAGSGRTDEPAADTVQDPSIPPDDPMANAEDDDLETSGEQDSLQAGSRSSDTDTDEGTAFDKISSFVDEALHTEYGFDVFRFFDEEVLRSRPRSPTGESSHHDQATARNSTSSRGDSQFTASPQPKGEQIEGQQSGVHEVNLITARDEPADTSSHSSEMKWDTDTSSESQYSMKSSDRTSDDSERSDVNKPHLSVESHEASSTERESPREITGYTGHGEDQALGRDDGRGVTDAAMHDAVNNPIKPVLEQAHPNGPTYLHQGKDAVVVLNQNGQVVTTYAKSSKGLRNP